jgi:hypothetical protein
MGPRYRPTATGLRMLIPLLMAATLCACSHSTPEPVTLNYLRLGWIPPYELPATEALSRKFTRETGVGLRHLRGVQEETLDQLTPTRKLLEESASGADVLQIDVTWLGVPRGDLTDLRPYFGAESFVYGPGRGVQLYSGRQDGGDSLSNSIGRSGVSS